MPRKINVFERRKHWLQKYKVAKGCEECGYNKCPTALHFDHRAPGSKHSLTKAGLRKTSVGGGMANLMRASIPREVLMAEVRKCGILCANCHSEKTWQEKLKGKKG